MPLSSHTARVSAGAGTLSVSQPEGGKEHCGPMPADTLDATAADRASGVDSTSQEPNFPSEMPDPMKLPGASLKSIHASRGDDADVVSARNTITIGVS